MRMPRGMPRSGAGGAPPGGPDEACTGGSQEPVIGAPGPVLPVIALVVGLGAQREVFGVDAQAVVAAMPNHLNPPRDRALQCAANEQAGRDLSSAEWHLAREGGGVECLCPSSVIWIKSASRIHK